MIRELTAQPINGPPNRSSLGTHPLTNLEAHRPADRGTDRPTDLGIHRPTNLGTDRPTDDLATYRPTDLGTDRPTNEMADRLQDLGTHCQSPVRSQGRSSDRSHQQLPDQTDDPRPH